MTSVDVDHIWSVEVHLAAGVHRDEDGPDVGLKTKIRKTRLTRGLTNSITPSAVANPLANAIPTTNFFLPYSLYLQVGLLRLLTCLSGHKRNRMETKGEMTRKAG